MIDTIVAGVLSVVFNAVAVVVVVIVAYRSVKADDLRYKQGLFAVCVALIGFELSILLALAVPIMSVLQIDAGRDSTRIWTCILFPTGFGFISLLFPLAIAYYYSESDPRINTTKPWVQSLKYALPPCTIMIIAAILFYFTNRDIPFTVCGAGGEATKCSEQDVRLNFWIACGALIGVISHVVWSTLAPLLYPAILWTCVLKICVLPKKLGNDDYIKIQKKTYDRAALILQVTDKLMTDAKNLTALNGVSKFKATTRYNKKQTAYLEALEILETDAAMLKGTQNSLNGVLHVVKNLPELLLHVLMNLYLLAMLAGTVMGLPNFSVVEYLVVNTEFFILKYCYTVTNHAMMLVYDLLSLQLLSQLPIVKLFLPTWQKRENCATTITVFSVWACMSCMRLFVTSDLALHGFLQSSEISPMFILLGALVKRRSSFFFTKVWGIIGLVVWVLMIVIRGWRSRRHEGLRKNKQLRDKRWNKLLMGLGANQKDLGVIETDDSEEVEEKPESTGFRARIARIDENIEAAPQKLGRMVNPFAR